MNESPLGHEEAGGIALETERLLGGDKAPTNEAELQMFFIEEYFLHENADISREQFKKDNRLQIEAMHLWNANNLSKKFREMANDPRYKGVTSIKLEDGDLVWSD